MAKQVPPTTMLMTNIRSSAPSFCSWPAARRTSFQTRSSRIAMLMVSMIVATMPAKATSMAERHVAVSQ